MPFDSIYHSSTIKRLQSAQLKRLAKEFENWMDSNKHSKQSDLELLLIWLDKDKNSRGVKKHEDFLALAQEVAALGYGTALDVPMSKEDFANRKIADYFESWLHQNPQPLMRSAEYLLAWIEKGKGAQYITDCIHFLQLAQTLANRGYKPSLDLPAAAADFKEIHRVASKQPRETIFLVITKKLLEDHITAIKDKAPTNFMTISQELSIFGVENNHEASTMRQSLAADLLYEIDQVTNTGDDKKNQRLLKSLVAKYLERTTKTGDYPNVRSDRPFSEAMHKAIELIQKIYSKLQDVKLLDTPYYDEPLNKFHFHMAQYFSKIIVTSLSPNLMSHIPTTKALTEKERLITQTLEKCANITNTLNKDDPLYSVYQRKLVIEHIEKLIAGCQMLNSSKPSSSGTCFFFGVRLDMSSLESNSDFLTDCLREAIEEISSEMDMELDIMPTP